MGEDEVGNYVQAGKQEHADLQKTQKSITVIMDYRKRREFYNLKNATLTCFVWRASLCVTDVLVKQGSVPFLKTNKRKVNKKKKPNSCDNANSYKYFAKVAD